MGIIFANEQTINKMRQIGSFEKHVLFSIPLNEEVSANVADHTDLSVFIADAIYVAPCIYKGFQDQIRAVIDEHPRDASLQRLLFEGVVYGISTLQKTYPFDIAFNAVKLKNHFFHKLTHTEPKILAAMTCEKVAVKQGYTRCSTMILSDSAVITEDAGLAKTYEACGYEVLLITKGHVELPGFEYGFFGGSGGVVEDILVLNGTLNHHPDNDEIKRFVHRHGLEILELHDGPLLDCGSILYNTY